MKNAEIMALIKGIIPTVDAEGHEIKTCCGVRGNGYHVICNRICPEDKLTKVYTILRGVTVHGIEGETRIREKLEAYAAHVY